MRGLITLANGFEDTEALTTIDLLSRASIALDIINMNGNGDNVVTTQYNNKIIVPLMYDAINPSDYDFIVIPGGKAISNYLYNDKNMEKLVKHFVENDKVVCAICAGPMVVGKHGYYDKHKFTCYKGCEDGIKGVYTGKGVTISGKFITGKSMSHTVDFALAIIQELMGKDIRKKIEKII